jgi:hypothetical protein
MGFRIELMVHFESWTMPLTKLKCTQLCFHFIPSHLRYVVQVRLASTASSTPYSYPTHRHPKPHEIFHLPLGASQAEIKSRCMYADVFWKNWVPKLAIQDIDLVRIHHPDSVLCGHLPPAERHARFQAISTAYDHLRGNSATIRSTPSYDDQLYEEIRWRARRTHKRRADRPPETDYVADIVPIIFGGLVSNIFYRNSVCCMSAITYAPFSWYLWLLCQQWPQLQEQAVGRPPSTSQELEVRPKCMARTADKKSKNRLVFINSQRRRKSVARISLAWVYS